MTLFVNTQKQPPKVFYKKGVLRNLKNFKILRTKNKLNLQSIVKTVGMFFDLLGLISPIVLQPKLLFKQVCAVKFKGTLMQI